MTSDRAFDSKRARLCEEIWIFLPAYSFDGAYALISTADMFLWRCKGNHIHQIFSKIRIWRKWKKQHFVNCCFVKNALEWEIISDFNLTINGPLNAVSFLLIISYLNTCWENTLLQVARIFLSIFFSDLNEVMLVWFESKHLIWGLTLCSARKSEPYFLS